VPRMQHEVLDRLDANQRAQDGSLLQLPSVLYGEAADSRHGRSGRALPEAPRSLALIPMRRRLGVAARIAQDRFADLSHTLRTVALSARPASGAAYGGQALIDGILMRGPSHIGVALRTVDGGIAVTSERIVTGPIRRRLTRIPVLRGAVVLWETLALGSRWLLRSADVSAGDEERSTGGTGSTIATLAVTLLIAVAVFNVLPAIAASAIVHALGLTSLLVERAIDGLLQVGILLGYLSAVGRSSDVDRTYRYHGAEHRAIHAFENGDPLTRDALSRWPTAHPRCGTEFLVVVILVSIVSFSLVGRLDPVPTAISRIVGIPIVAGLAYEILRLLGRYRTNVIARTLAAPGIAVQRITTRMPDDGMHDIAIAALAAAIEAEGGVVPSGSERPITRALQQVPVR
jgi:uncharacterized protein YqhQ